jgi:hypothetical protein
MIAVGLLIRWIVHVHSLDQSLDQHIVVRSTRSPHFTPLAPAPDITHGVKYVLRNIVGNIELILIIGGGVTLSLGYAWLSLLKRFTSHMVFGTLYAVITVELVLTFIFYAKAGVFGAHDPFSTQAHGDFTWRYSRHGAMHGACVHCTLSLHTHTHTHRTLYVHIATHTLLRTHMHSFTAIIHSHPSLPLPHL